MTTVFKETLKGSRHNVTQLHGFQYILLVVLLLGNTTLHPGGLGKKDHDEPGDACDERAEQAVEAGNGNHVNLVATLSLSLSLVLSACALNRKHCQTGEGSFLQYW